MINIFKIRFKYRLSVFYTSLKFFGFGDFEPKKEKIGKFYYTYSTILLVIMLIESYFILYGTVLEENINKKIYGVAINCTHILFILKYIAYVRNGRNIQSIVDVVETKCYEFTNESAFFDKANVAMYAVLRNYAAMSNIAILGYVYVTLADTANASGPETGWQLVPMHIPYDFTFTENGTLVVKAFITVFILLNGYYHVFIDIATAALFIQVGGQFEAVAHCFEQLQFAGHNSEIEASEAKRQFVNAVEYHKTVLRCAEDLQNTFCFIFLAQIIESSLPLCMTLWLTVKTIGSPNPPIMDLTSHLMFMSFLLYQLYILTRYADNITHQALKVCDGVWLSEWQLAGAEGHRGMALVSLRAGRPVRFSALGLVGINVNTFIEVVKNAYAFFTLLNKSNV